MSKRVLFNILPSGFVIYLALSIPFFRRFLMCFKRLVGSNNSTLMFCKLRPIKKPIMIRSETDHIQKSRHSSFSDQGAIWRNPALEDLFLAEATSSSSSSSSYCSPPRGNIFCSDYEIESMFLMLDPRKMEKAEEVVTEIASPPRLFHLFNNIAQGFLTHLWSNRMIFSIYFLGCFLVCRVIDGGSLQCTSILTTISLLPSVAMMAKAIVFVLLLKLVMSDDIIATAVISSVATVVLMFLGIVACIRWLVGLVLRRN